MELRKRVSDDLEHDQFYNKLRLQKLKVEKDRF